MSYIWYFCNIKVQSAKRSNVSVHQGVTTLTMNRRILNGRCSTSKNYSDWATTAIPADVKSMWYRLSRREDDFCIECSTDGKEWSQMRVCHMYEAKDEISFGIYACSPEDSSFKAVFSNMQLTECAWKAHDGQQPDEE